MSKKIKKDLIAILLDAIKKGWKPQTVIDTVDSLWPDGHDVKQITYNIVDNSITIINNDNSTTVINLAEVIAGDGMDFSDNDPVTLGLPSTIDSDTINEVTETSHTHELGNISIDNIVAGTTIKYGALYNWYAVIDPREISSTIEWIVPSEADIIQLLEYIDDVVDVIYPLAGGMLKELGVMYWETPNIGATNEFNFNLRGVGGRDSGGEFGSLFTECLICTITEKTSTTPLDAMCGFTVIHNTETAEIGQSLKGDAQPFRLVRDATESELLLDDGVYTTDYIGNNNKTYHTVKIGTQVWLASNLNETKYRNGDWIHGYDNGVYTPISNTDWAALTTEAMCYYDDNEDNGGSQINLEDFLIRTRTNVQAGRLTGLALRTVEVTFTTPFAAIPAGLPRLYRMVADGGVYLMQDVLFSYPSPDWLTTTGFTITIDPAEDLNGIIMIYDFKESNYTA